MQAIILGAGRGSRLGAMSNGLPKVLLSIGGEYLLDRQRSLIAQAFPEIEAITVVVGFRVAEVQAVGGPTMRYVQNDAFMTTNTATSLYLALQLDDQDALLLNGDVFCDLGALRNARQLANGAVCEFKPRVDAEEIQVCLSDDGWVNQIGKDIGGCAEAVGIYRLSHDFLRRYRAHYTDLDAGRYYEDVFNRMITVERMRFEAVPLGAGRAIEIDTPADLARAELTALELKERT